MCIRDRPESAWLDAVEAQMVQHGAALMQGRATLVVTLAVRLATMPAEPFARPALTYAPGAPGHADGLSQALFDNRRRDRAAQRTLAGPHRDELDVIHAAKRVPAAQSSTGEQKAMLVAMTLAHAALAAQFEARTIKRAYHAFVWGAPMPPEGDIEGNIGRSRRNRTKMAVVSENQGKTALTHYRTIERYGLAATFLECRLSTGRTHQIRVHLTHIGHPLLGDPTYGRTTGARRSTLSADASTAIERLGRQALHAAEIGFEHPLSGASLSFTSPLPKDMQLVRNCFISDIVSE